MRDGSAGASPADFPASVPHGSDRYWRLNRAHLNCLEFLPMFAAVVLTGAVLGVTEGTVATLAEVMRDYIDDPRLESVFGALWPYLGLPPSRV